MMASSLNITPPLLKAPTVGSASPIFSSANPPECGKLRGGGGSYDSTGGDGGIIRSAAVTYTIIAALLILTYALILSSDAYALEVPQLTGYVNDHAGMISQQAKTTLEQELRAFEQSDSSQIVIVTVPSLDGEVLEQYSIKIAEAWKIGQKGKDNGIIFLIAKQEKKMRIEVGRGLEGKLTDLMAGRIIDLVVKPRFKRGDFDGGITFGAHALIDATRGEFKADTGPAKRSSGRHGTFSRFITFIIFGGIALLILGSFSRLFSGAAGAIGLPAMVYLLLSPIGLFAALVIGVLGMIIGLVLPSLFSAGGSGYHGGGFYGSGYGGFYGGGSGGDSGGSDFGGGGGGDFGGGGASGDW